MKTFAQVAIALSILGMLVGFIWAMAGDHVGDVMTGSALVGSGFSSILLSCVVVALADIRENTKLHVSSPQFGWVNDSVPVGVAALGPDPREQGVA